MCIQQPAPNPNWIVPPAGVQHLRGEAFAVGIVILRRWFARRRQLQALAALDDRLLTDAGVTREAAEQEIARSFWLAYARRHMK